MLNYESPFVQQKFCSPPPTFTHPLPLSQSDSEMSSLIDDSPQPKRTKGKKRTSTARATAAADEEEDVEEDSDIAETKKTTKKPRTSGSSSLVSRSAGAVSNHLQVSGGETGTFYRCSE